MGGASDVGVALGDSDFQPFQYQGTSYTQYTEGTAIVSCDCHVIIICDYYQVVIVPW